MKKDRFDIREWRKNNVLSESDANSYIVEIEARDIDFVGIDNVIPPEYEHDYTDAASSFTVNFGIDIEYRSWGIKSIIVIVRSVSGTIIITAFDSNETEKEFEIKCDDFEVETDITIDSDTITITHLEVDVLNKKILCT